MSLQIKRMARSTLLAVVPGLMVALAIPAIGADKPNPAMMEKQKMMMQKQLQAMKPELRAKVKALSPETRQLLVRVLSQHTKKSQDATMRQVMQEILGDYQRMVAGIVTDNKEVTAESALSLANHRIPKGGMLPYLRHEDITNEKIGSLASFNESVEGSARKLAEAARAGDMATAASHLSTIVSGCVGCHQVFRGVPGESPWLN
jgi:hypothetical protein